MSNKKMAQPRDGFGDALVELGQKDKNIIVLTADLTDSTRCAAFADNYPNRFVQMGVAEQNMMGVAAGLANEGMVPFCTSFAVFNPGRNWDQLRVSVCYSNANVKIIGAHAGLTVGQDGASHQALEDIAITRVLPNLVVLAPCDIHETKAATIAAAKHVGPVYIRFCRGDQPTVSEPGHKFSIGDAITWQEGSDVTVCTTGSMLQPTLEAVKSIRSRFSCEILHFPTIKPLDAERLIKSVRKTKKVVTVEEAQVAGGFGSAIAETLVKKMPVHINMVGIYDTFGESGEPQKLREKYHIAKEDIEAAIIATCLVGS